MSILDSIFGGLFGDNDDQNEVQTEHPCSNCPAVCEIAPQACSVCQPFKEKMIDALYRVEHKDEIISQYEVAGTSKNSGAVICPNCGGHSEDHYVCEYCGSRLQDGSGKIQVESASQIPNPVLECQDLIFSRYEAVKGFAGSDSAYGLEGALSGIGSEGLLSSIFSLLTGGGSPSDQRSIGNKMTESEIEAMADFYDVSVSGYLSGLDNGKYLTMSNKKACAEEEARYAKSHSDSSDLLSGMMGLSGTMGLSNMLFGGSSYNYSSARNYNPANDRRRRSWAAQGAHPPMQKTGRPPQMRSAQPSRSPMDRTATKRTSGISLNKTAPQSKAARPMQASSKATSARQPGIASVNDMLRKQQSTAKKAPQAGSKASQNQSSRNTGGKKR